MHIVITGSSGLLGWHTRVRLHAANCAARYNLEEEPFKIIPLDHSGFNDDKTLNAALKRADAVIHYAGVNRGNISEVSEGNPKIARRLINACKKLSVKPHIVYANSTHSLGESPYGRSKREAGEILSNAIPNFTNLILPHIFGENARPFYNNVTATFIFQILEDINPHIDTDGCVKLLYAGEVAEIAIKSIIRKKIGTINTVAKELTVQELFKTLESFHQLYSSNIYPDLAENFSRDLFNTYRYATYPDIWPRSIVINRDKRGLLFEAVKGGGGGQVFLSYTKPGVTRGDHFHLNKIERFLVLEGDAMIRMRKLFSDQIFEYRVSGDTPEAVDIPTLHTHSIENVGDRELLTLFWTHKLFDPSDPDTYANKVLL